MNRISPLVLGLMLLALLPFQPAALEAEVHTGALAPQLLATVLLDSVECTDGLVIDGDVATASSCNLARLAVLAAYGGTAVLILSPIPGDEVVVYGACLSAYEYWAGECLGVSDEDDAEDAAVLQEEFV